MSSQNTLKKLFISFDPVTAEKYKELRQEIRDFEDEIKQAAEAGQYDRIGLLCYARDVAKSQIYKIQK